VDYPAYKVSEIGWRRPRPDNRDIGSVSKVVGNPPPGIISGLPVIHAKIGQAAWCAFFVCSASNMPSRRTD
jgi:hypothetical protein